MQVRIPALTTLMIALIGLPGLASAEELTPAQIVEKATGRNALGFDSGAAQVKMVLQDKAGTQRTRRILSRTLQAEADRRSSIIRFLDPPDVKGSAFLLIQGEKQADGSRSDDDMYLYLPALKRVRRIAGKQKSGSFMGTDFTYADMESRDIKAATYERKADAAIEGVDCYHIIAKPSGGQGDAGASQYARIELWIDQTSFLPRQIKFYDQAGQFQKVYRLHEARQMEGRWVATKSQMWTKATGHSTFLYIESIDSKTPIDAAEMTPQALSRG